MGSVERRLAKLEAAFAPDLLGEHRFLGEELVEAIATLREEHPQSYEHIDALVARGTLPETVNLSELPSLVRDGLVSAEEGAALEALFLALNAEVTH